MTSQDRTYPPLVEPVARLSEEQLTRAVRQLPIPGFGEQAQRRLAAARVLVIGAGGLGSASVPYLAGSGVGTIGIVDDDRVEITNLHRQVAHGTPDLGRLKTDSLAESVQRLDPGITVRRHTERLTAANALERFAEYDLVIDGSDNFPTRYLSDDASRLSGVPLVWGAILQTHGRVGVAWHRYGPGYRDVFPNPPTDDGALNCAVGGVLPGLCGVIGSLLATEALKLITGLGEPLVGKLLSYDALSASFDTIPVRRNPELELPDRLVDYELFCSASDAPDPRAIALDELRPLLGGAPDTELRLIDVRERWEFDRRRLSQAQHLPLDRIEAGENPPEDTPIVLVCERGPRSKAAAEALAARGFAPRWLAGGTAAVAERAPELLHGSP